MNGNTHTATVCIKDNRTIDFHTKSYSFEFKCPECGKIRRQNTNYLGSKRHVVCDGERIVPALKSEFVLEKYNA